jgi:Cu/Ag efflux pump CusA
MPRTVRMSLRSNASSTLTRRRNFNVLVSHYSQLWRQGGPLDKDVMQGTLDRLVPLLMTAAIAALGLIPMLLATGVGSEVQRPLAAVAVGGLLSCALLTLFLSPVFYAVFSGGWIKRLGLAGSPHEGVRE